ncbi:MAG TPA: ester cyclase [Bryobacteraceae bacterium]|nr:ester cyclase [Bryobacteraceae bacterium]
MNPENIHRALAAAWNARDFDRLRALLNPDYSYTGPDGHEQQGPEASIAVARLFAAAFPDGRLEVDRVHVAGNVVIAEMTGRGTHGGDFLGIAPTNRPVTLKICNVMEVRNGKATREREYFDMASIFAQLGVSRLPAQVARA